MVYRAENVQLPPVVEPPGIMAPAGITSVVVDNAGVVNVVALGRVAAAPLEKQAAVRNLRASVRGRPRGAGSVSVIDWLRKMGVLLGLVMVRVKVPVASVPTVAVDLSGLNDLVIVGGSGRSTQFPESTTPPTASTCVAMMGSDR